MPDGREVLARGATFRATYREGALDPLNDSDRRDLLIFAGTCLESAQDPPAGSFARWWLLLRAGEALDLAEPVDPVEVVDMRRRWLEPLRAGKLGTSARRP